MTRIDLTGPRKANVTGDLTLNGVTKPVTLAVTFNGGWGPQPMDRNRARIGFSPDTDAAITLKHSMILKHRMQELPSAGIAHRAQRKQCRGNEAALVIHQPHSERLVNELTASR